ncbi:MAG TPA: hypothetical protein VFQ12_10930 [Thermoleophilaceae bacterium]|nr:hypothetical protein [Thermoleophilaceae bacterium]
MRLAAVLALAALGAGAAPAGATKVEAPPVTPGCDPIGTAHCLLPWPNDYFTERAWSRTGRRLALLESAMPRNRNSVPIEPSDYNLSDGFSPGQTIVVKVPGLDTPAAFSRTGAVPVTDLARAYDKRQPVVVINARTRRRHLIWAELDSNATTPESTALLIHPGVNFREGERYIVALRNLKGADGEKLRAGRAFRLYRDRIRTSSKEFERRRWHMESIFHSLGKAGIKRHDLYLAWDFTVASGSSLSRRLLSIRDRAFAELGDRNLRDLEVAGVSPRFTVDNVIERTPAEEPNVLRRVEGTVTVPCFLNQPGCPSGARYELGPDGLPTRIPGNTYTARYVCNVPRSASADAPARPSLYGHGLFGDAGEAGARNVEELGNENNVLVCAADWIGMAEEDVPNAVQILLNLSNFPSLADRLQQGFLDFMFLGRTMIHPAGFASHPAFQQDGRPLIDTRWLFYYGNSQGGIAGGALTAVAPDFDRSVLYVGAMNYSLLLNRSVDFDLYALLLNPSYPNELERQLILSMIQVLWDRGEPNGYAWHMTDDPYRNTPRHKVLQILSFGDHQVANLATEVQARTIGSRLRLPAVDPGRHADRTPYFGIPPIRRFPYEGSASLVVWDIGPLRPPGCGVAGAPECLGTLTPPTANLPPRVGVDPHDLVIQSEPSVRRQIAEFLRVDGRLIDVCGAFPCHAAGWTGP